MATNPNATRSVLPTSDRTFEVDWIETSRDLYGNVKTTDGWKGTFTIAVNTPTDERHCVNSISLKFNENDPVIDGDSKKPESKA